MRRGFANHGSRGSRQNFSNYRHSRPEHFPRENLRLSRPLSFGRGPRLNNEPLGGLHRFGIQRFPNSQADINFATEKGDGDTVSYTGGTKLEDKSPDKQKLNCNEFENGELVEGKQYITVNVAEAEAAKATDWKMCALCDLNFSSKEEAEDHVKWNVMHQLKSKQAKEGVSPPIAFVTGRDSTKSKELLEATSTSDGMTGSFDMFNFNEPKRDEPEPTSSSDLEPTSTNDELPNLSDTDIVVKKGGPPTLPNPAADQDANNIRCAPCQMTFKKQEQYAAHIRGLAHMQRAKAQQGAVNANSSPTSITSSSDDRSNEHNLSALPSETNSNGQQQEEWRRCSDCNILFNKLADYDTHVASDVHKTIKALNAAKQLQQQATLSAVISSVKPPLTTERWQRPPRLSGPLNAGTRGPPLAANIASTSGQRPTRPPLAAAGEPRLRVDTSAQYRMDSRPSPSGPGVRMSAAAGTRPPSLSATRNPPPMRPPPIPAGLDFQKPPAAAHLSTTTPSRPGVPQAGVRPAVRPYTPGGQRLPIAEAGPGPRFGSSPPDSKRPRLGSMDIFDASLAENEPERWNSASSQLPLSDGQQQLLRAPLRGPSSAVAARQPPPGGLPMQMPLRGYMQLSSRGYPAQNLPSDRPPMQNHPPGVPPMQHPPVGELVQNHPSAGLLMQQQSQPQYPQLQPPPQPVLLPGQGPSSSNYQQQSSQDFSQLRPQQAQSQDFTLPPPRMQLPVQPVPPPLQPQVLQQQQPQKWDASSSAGMQQQPSSQQPPFQQQHSWDASPFASMQSQPPPHQHQPSYQQQQQPQPFQSQQQQQPPAQQQHPPAGYPPGAQQQPNRASEPQASSSGEAVNPMQAAANRALELLTKLSTTGIDNEEEAMVAYKLSSALSQALVEYKNRTGKEIPGVSSTQSQGHGQMPLATAGYQVPETVQPSPAASSAPLPQGQGQQLSASPAAPYPTAGEAYPQYSSYGYPGYAAAGWPDPATAQAQYAAAMSQWSGWGTQYPYGLSYGYPAGYPYGGLIAGSNTATSSGAVPPIVSYQPGSQLATTTSTSSTSSAVAPLPNYNLSLPPGYQLSAQPPLPPEEAEKPPLPASSPPPSKKKGKKSK